MPRSPSPKALPVLVRAQQALGCGQRELADLLGVSKRTVIRWAGGLPSPLPSQVQALVTAVFEADPSAAAAIAGDLGTSLDALGLPLPPVANAPTEPASPAHPHAPVLAKAPIDPRDLVDAALCAAAEAASLPPQAVRPAVVAALARVVKLGLTAEEALAALTTDGGR